MTFKNLAILSLILWAGLILLKIWFLNHIIFGSSEIQNVVFLVLIAIFTTAIVRRLGVIHYIEAIFVLSVWTGGALVLDFLVTGSIINYYFLTTQIYWISFLSLAFSAFLFHKKRHVHIRNEHAKHHGHGGHH